MMSKPFTMLAAIFFLLFAAIHGYRLYSHFSVVIADYVIPLWFSSIGVALGLVLGAMLLRDARR
jgi:hypothetical protein